MTAKEVREAAALLDTRNSFGRSPEEFGEVVDSPTWAIMTAAGREYVDRRLMELCVTIDSAPPRAGGDGA